MLPLLVLVPLLLVFAINLPLGGFLRRVSAWIAGAFFVLETALVALRPAWFWGINSDFLNPFFAFHLYADGLSKVVFAATGLVAFVTLLVGTYSFTDEIRRFKFINLLLVSVTGMNAVAMVTDIFSLYIFIEVVAVTAFILIAIQKDIRALEGAFKYIILSVVASTLMLSAIAMLFLVAGDTSFSAIAAMLKASSGSIFVKIAVMLFLGGLFIKSGVVPFHGWLPDAYSSAPSSVSVFLAGIVTKVSGVYVLMRLVISVIGFTPAVKTTLMAFGLFSILVGALAAIGQRDFKRMLAYSSISQVGYMVLALGCGTPLAVAGAIFHFFNHAIFKSLLFVNAASVEEGIGTVNMNDMGGLSVRMPVTGATSVIGLLSTAGIPPLSGFWSKFIIVIALWLAGNKVYASVALLASVFTLGYLLSMQRRIFFGKLKEGLETVKESGSPIVVAQAVLAAVTIGIGVGFPFMVDVFMKTAQNILK